MFDMISDDRINSVQLALKTLFGNISVQQAILLPAGSLSVVVKVMIHDEAYILRVMDLLDDNLFNRQNQIKCLKKASELNLGPVCLYDNAHDGILITKYIQSTKITVTRPWLHEIAVSLQKLHADSTFPEPHQALFDYMDTLIISLRARELSPLLIQYLDNIDYLKTCLTPHLELTSSHNDLNFSNLLFDGSKTYFIDWEAAGQEDSFFDLATICNEFISNESDISYFLSEYFNGEPTAYQQAKLLCMRQISYCYLALHFLDHAAQAGLKLNQDCRLKDIPTINAWIQGYDTKTYCLNTEDDFFLYAMTKVKASVEQMQTDNFAFALKRLDNSKLR
jgi:thiamine kinase-like enzyme